MAQVFLRQKDQAMASRSGRGQPIIFLGSVNYPLHSLPRSQLWPLRTKHPGRVRSPLRSDRRPAVASGPGYFFSGHGGSASTAGPSLLG